MYKCRRNLPRPFADRGRLCRLHQNVPLTHGIIANAVSGDNSEPGFVKHLAAHAPNPGPTAYRRITALPISAPS